MKLLHELFRLRHAGIAGASARRLSIPRDFSITVPAPLAGPVVETSTVVELAVARAARREPASFLKTTRHRRWVSGC
ncbi:MAG: hypothetical protein ABI389_04695 [Rhodanobacter sp.]